MFIELLSSKFLDVGTGAIVQRVISSGSVQRFPNVFDDCQQDDSPPLVHDYVLNSSPSPQNP